MQTAGIQPLTKQDFTFSLTHARQQYPVDLVVEKPTQSLVVAALRTHLM